MADDALVAGFAALGSSTVSDALDRLGLDGACPGLLPPADGFRLCGRAYTLLYEPVDETGGTVGDYIDDVPPGAVAVLDNGGRTDCTVWGDILTSVASRRGIAGTVIDGVCRDVARSLELGYPVFSRGRSMRTGKDRVRLAAVGLDVHLGGVTVAPGDIVLGDADGVVVVPGPEAARVLDAALEIDRAEDEIRRAVEAGARLDEARTRFGYHRLQSDAEQA